MSRRTSRKPVPTVSPSMEEFVPAEDFDFAAAFQSPKGVVTRARRSSIGGNAKAPLAKPKTRRQSIMPTLEELPAEKPTSRRRSVLPPPPPPKTKIPVKKETTLAKPAPAPKKVATKVKKAPSPKKKEAPIAEKELELRLEEESPPTSPVKLGILSSSFYGTPKKTTLKEPTKVEKIIAGKDEKKVPIKASKKSTTKVEKKTPAKVEKEAPAKTKKKAPVKAEKKTPAKIEKKSQPKIEKKTPAKVETKAGAKLEKKSPAKAENETSTKGVKKSSTKVEKETIPKFEEKEEKKMPVENKPPSPKIAPAAEKESYEESQPLVISPIKADRGIMASSFYNSPKKPANLEKLNDDSFIENIDDMFVKTPEDGEKPTTTFETEAPKKTKRRRTMIEIKSPIVKVKENEKSAPKSDMTEINVNQVEIETSTPKKTPKPKAKKVESKKTKTPNTSKTPKKTPKVTKSVKVNVRKMKARKTPKTPAKSKTPKTTVVSTKKVKAKTPKVSPSTAKSTPVVSSKVSKAKTPKATPLTRNPKEKEMTPRTEKTGKKSPKVTPNVEKAITAKTPKTKTVKTPKSTVETTKSKTPKSTPKTTKPKTPKNPKHLKLKIPKSSTPKLTTTGKKRKLTAVQVTPIAKKLKANQSLKTPAAIDPGNLLKRKLKRTVETAIDEKLANQPKTTPHIMMEGVSESGSPRKILAPLHTSTILNTEFVKQHLTGTPAVKKARKLGTALRPNPMFLGEHSTLLTPQRKENINSTPMKENRFAGAPHPLDSVDSTPILAPGKLEPISPEPQMVTGKLEKLCSIM